MVRGFGGLLRDVELALHRVQRQRIVLEGLERAGQRADLVAPLGAGDRHREIAGGEPAHELRHAAQRPGNLRHHDPDQKTQRQQPDDAGAQHDRRFGAASGGERRVPGRPDVGLAIGGDPAEQRLDLGARDAALAARGRGAAGAQALALADDRPRDHRLEFGKCDARRHDHGALLGPDHERQQIRELGPDPHLEQVLLRAQAIELADVAREPRVARNHGCDEEIVGDLARQLEPAESDRRWPRCCDRPPRASNARRRR